MGAHEELAERAQGEAESYVHTYPDVMGGKTIIMNHQRHQEALDKAEEMKTKQRAGTTPLGRTFMRDADRANAFSKLSRYETGIEQRFYKAWHELQRLQAARRTEGNVPPPVAIDVDVYGVSGEDR